MTDLDWTEFYIEQAYRAAQALTNNERRLGWKELEHLKDAHRWLSMALEEAQKLEEEAKHGRADSETA